MRRLAFRIVLVVYALFWLNVAFSASPTGGVHRLQESAFRILFAVLLVVVPEVLQLRRAEEKAAAQQQVVLSATAHMLATFVAGYVDPLAYVLVAVAILIGFLHPARDDLLLRPERASIASLVVAGSVCVPLVAFCAAEARRLMADGSSPPKTLSSSRSPSSSACCWARSARRAGASRHGPRPSLSPGTASLPCSNLVSRRAGDASGALLRPSAPQLS